MPLVNQAYRAPKLMLAMIWRSSPG